jgi:hypothetical protein
MQILEESGSGRIAEAAANKIVFKCCFGCLFDG